MSHGQQRQCQYFRRYTQATYLESPAFHQCRQSRWPLNHDLLSAPPAACPFPPPPFQVSVSAGTTAVHMDVERVKKPPPRRHQASCLHVSNVECAVPPPRQTRRSAAAVPEFWFSGADGLSPDGVCGSPRTPPHLLPNSIKIISKHHRVCTTIADTRNRFWSPTWADGSGGCGDGEGDWASGDLPRGAGLGGCGEGVRLGSYMMGKKTWIVFY